MPQNDPYASIAKPDPYASIAKPDQQGGESAPSQSGTTIKAAPKMFSKAWLKEKFYNGAKWTADVLPAAGGTAGGIIGGAGGTVAGVGVGGVPGAIGGAAVGGTAGESAKQLMYHGFGWDDAPQTSGEAALRIGKEGAIQGAIEGTGQALRPLMGVVKGRAVTQYGKALAPTKEATKEIAAKITPEMIDRGIVGTPKGILKDSVGHMKALQPEIDAAIGQIPPSKLKNAVTDAYDALEKLKTDRYMVNGKIADPTAVSAIEGVQKTLLDHVGNASPESIRKLRMIFDNPVAHRAGYAGGDLSTQYALQAKKAAANTFRDILNSSSADVARLNNEYSFWANVRQVTKETARRQTGQSGGLTKVLGPLATASAGAAGLAHSPTTSLEAMIGTQAFVALTQAMRSPVWRTTSAVIKDRIADALATGNAAAVTKALARIGVTAAEHYSPALSGEPKEQGGSALHGDEQ